MNLSNKDTSALKSLNLSVQLLSTINTTQTKILEPKSKPITTLEKLKTRLTQANKKFDHNKEKAETTLMWIKQQGVNLNNIREIAKQERKQQQQKVREPVVGTLWQQFEQKQFQSLSFNDFIFKNQERIAYRAITQCLAKSDNKVDHMKLLKKRNLQRFNGKKIQSIHKQDTRSSQNWQFLMEEYERAINSSILNEKGINLTQLLQNNNKIYSRYISQYLQLFYLTNSKPPHQKSKEYPSYNINKEKSIRQLQKIRSADRLKVQILYVIQQCLKYGLYDCFLEKYTLLQDTYQIDKQSMLFVHLFIQIIAGPNKDNIDLQIVRQIIIKLASFVKNLKFASSNLFQGYYCVLLQCLLLYRSKFENIVKEVCQIVLLQLSTFDQFGSDQSIFSYYLQNINYLLYYILQNIQIVKEQDHISIAQKCLQKINITEEQENELSQQDINQINQLYGLFKDTLTRYIINSYRNRQPDSNDKGPFITNDGNRDVQRGLQLFEQHKREEDDLLGTFLTRFKELSQLVKHNKKEEFKQNNKKYEFIRYNYFDFMIYLKQLGEKYNQNYLQILVLYYEQLRAMYNSIFLSSGNLTKLQQLQKQLSLQLKDLYQQYPQINSIRFGQLIKQLSQ